MKLFCTTLNVIWDQSYSQRIVRVLDVSMYPGLEVTKKDDNVLDFCQKLARCEVLFYEDQRF